MTAKRRLGEVSTIVMGQAPPGRAYNSEARGWPLIAGAGDFGETRPSPRKYTTTAAKISRPGDIVLAVRASIGEKVVADGEYCLGRGVAAIRASAGLDTRYLWHWLGHVAPALAAKGKGATFKQVGRRDIAEMPIVLPALADQRRIAATLDRAGELRTKRRAAAGLVDELAQSMFLDMFGDPGENPRGWPARRLAEVLAEPLRNGLSPSSGGRIRAKVLTLPAITGSRFDPTAVKTSAFTSAPAARQAVNELDLLVCRGNGNLELMGRGYFPTADMPDTTFPDTMTAARVDHGVVTREFLERLWGTVATRRQIEALARTTNGTYKINHRALGGVRLIVPPIEEQLRFTSRLHAMRRVQERHSAQSSALGELVASLHGRAFPGSR